VRNRDDPGFPIGQQCHIMGVAEAKDCGALINRGRIHCSERRSKGSNISVGVPDRDRFIVIIEGNPSQRQSGCGKAGCEPCFPFPLQAHRHQMPLHQRGPVKSSVQSRLYADRRNDRRHLNQGPSER